MKSDPEPSMHPITSSMATHAGYDPQANALFVKYNNGKTFCYADVGADKAHTVLNAASFGSALNRHVLNKHEGRLV